MYNVYILQNCKNHDLYYGYTTNLKRRLDEHNSNQKWELIYYEAYRSEKDARVREKKLKHYGQSRSHLKNRIVNSLHKN